MNLLVTGGAGFIGSNLIRHVINETEVSRLVNLDCLTYAGHLDNLSDLESHPKYAFEQVDLTSKSGVAEVVRRHEITHVMHLAAESHVDRSIVGPDDFIQTNVVGTLYLLEACRSFWGGNSADHRFLMSPRMKFTEAWGRPVNSVRRLLTRPIPPIRRAKRPPTCSSGPIIT